VNAKILTVSLIGVLSVAVAPAARADGTQDFLDAVHAAGLTSTMGTDSFLVLSAMKQCHEMDRGVPPAEIADVISQVNPALGPELSATIVVLAIQYFCPAHMPPAAHAADQFA
jgi:Protein of unknown function (DUF732)